MLLKPNMIVSGDDCARQANAQGGGRGNAPLSAASRARGVPASCSCRVVNPTSSRPATLDAINRMGGAKPWKLSFSFGRALQDAALATWRGDPANVASAQKAFYDRASQDSLASLGAYTTVEPAPGGHAGSALRCAAARRLGRS